MNKLTATAFLILLVPYLIYAQDLQNGLLAYYPFNGNANDASGKSNDGTVLGALLTTDRLGNSNSAYKFDGIDDLITLSPGNFNVGVGDITIAAWVKAENTGRPARIFSDRTNCNHGQGGLQLLTLGDGTVNGGVCKSGGGEGAESTTSVFGDWYHVVARRQSSILSVYINGRLEKSTAAPRNANNSNVAEIGGSVEVGAGDQYFQGTIDEVRIYNRALSASEIDLLSEKTPDLNAGLVAYFPFNGNANDESTNDHDGTPSGASLTKDRFNCLNSAYNFDGTDDFIQIPTSPALRSAQYSVSLWLKTTQTPQDQSIPFSGQYHHSGSDGNGYQLEINQFGGIGVDQFTRPTVNHGGGAASGPLTDGLWHHVVASWDGAVTSVYLDGVLAGTQVTPCCNGAQPGPIRWTTPFLDFKVGFTCDPLQASFSEYYSGKLDDIRIYNRVLLPDEVNRLFGMEHELCNSRPVADAGPFQAVECTSLVGSEVALDGSASADADGDPLTFTWTGPFGTVNGVSPTVTLPLRTHTIILTVDDGNGGTDTDAVTVEIVDTTAPVLTSALKLMPACHMPAQKRSV